MKHREKAKEDTTVPTPNDAEIGFQSRPSIILYGTGPPREPLLDHLVGAGESEGGTGSQLCGILRLTSRNNWSAVPW